MAAEPAAKPYRPPPTLQAIVNHSTYIVVARPISVAYFDGRTGERFDIGGPNRFGALEVVVEYWLFPEGRTVAGTMRIGVPDPLTSRQAAIERYVDKTLIFFLEETGPMERPIVRAVPFVLVLGSKAEPIERLDETRAAIRTRMEKGW